MPVRVVVRDSKFRVVEGQGRGRIAKNRFGTAADGGGHATRTKAEAQARAINARSK